MLTPCFSGRLTHLIELWAAAQGSKQNESIHLSVYAFTLSDVELLIIALNERYNIKCSIHATEKGPRIYVNKKNMKILKPLVRTQGTQSAHYLYRAFNEI